MSFIGFCRNYGPSVRMLLEQYGLTAGQVPPSGPHGVLLKGDVLRLVKEKNLTPKALDPGTVGSQYQQ